MVGKRQGADSASPREGGGKGWGQAQRGRGGGSDHSEDCSDDDDHDEVVFGQVRAVFKNMKLKGERKEKHVRAPDLALCGCLPLSKV